MNVWRNPSILLMATVLLLQASCSSNHEQASLKFDNHLKLMGLDNLAGQQRAQQKSAFEKRQRLVSYIESSGVVDKGEIDANIERIRTEKMVSEYFEKIYQQQITDKSISDYYQSHQQDYLIKEHNIAHILIRIASEASEEERAVAQTTSQEILSKLYRGDSFMDMAKEYSKDEKAADVGGALGWRSPGELNSSLLEAAKKLQVGDQAIVINANYGLHIVKKDTSLS